MFKQIWFFVFQIKMKNEKRTSNLNFNVQLFWKSKNHFILGFTSQLQYKNKNQNFISNFGFQFIKKQNEMVLYVHRLFITVFSPINALSLLTPLSNKRPPKIEFFIQSSLSFKRPSPINVRILGGRLLAIPTLVWRVHWYFVSKFKNDKKQHAIW